jgi:ribosomal protein S27E
MIDVENPSSSFVKAKCARCLDELGAQVINTKKKEIVLLVCSSDSILLHT